MGPPDKVVRGFLFPSRMPSGSRHQDGGGFRLMTGIRIRISVIIPAGKSDGIGCHANLDDKDSQSK